MNNKWRNFKGYFIKQISKTEYYILHYVSYEKKVVRIYVNTLDLDIDKTNVSFDDIIRISQTMIDKCSEELYTDKNQYEALMYIDEFTRVNNLLAS